jgi:hypothetical protein
MYWKAAIVKYEGEGHVRVSIFLYKTKADEKPVLHILGTLECSGVKRKWRKPMKIKRWLLYDSHSYSYASRYLKKTIFNDAFKVTEVGEMKELGLFDKDIITKKFPMMARNIFREVKKKKRRKH